METIVVEPQTPEEPNKRLFATWLNERKDQLAQEWGVGSVSYQEFANYLGLGHTLVWRIAAGEGKEIRYPAAWVLAHIFKKLELDEAAQKEALYLIYQDKLAMPEKGGRRIL